MDRARRTLAYAKTTTRPAEEPYWVLLLIPVSLFIVLLVIFKKAE